MADLGDSASRVARCRCARLSLLRLFCGRTASGPDIGSVWRFHTTPLSVRPVDAEAFSPVAVWIWPCQRQVRAGEVIRVGAESATLLSGQFDHCVLGLS